jgi:hypothetical protein
MWALFTTLESSDSVRSRCSTPAFFSISGASKLATGADIIEGIDKALA